MRPPRGKTQVLAALIWYDDRTEIHEEACEHLADFVGDGPLPSLVTSLGCQAWREDAMQAVWAACDRIRPGDYDGAAALAGGIEFADCCVTITQLPPIPKTEKDA